DYVQQLLNLYASGEVLWLETPKFTAPVIITGLNLNHQPGTYTPFTLTLEEAPYWGRTTILQGENAKLKSLDEAESGREILSPLWADYAWTWSRMAKQFSLEYILENTGASDEWVKLETHVPDHLREGEDIRLYAWNPEAGAYDLKPFARWNAEEGVHIEFDHTRAWLLDGSKLSDHYANAEDCLTTYPKGLRGEILTALAGNAGNITLSLTHGCKHRTTYAIKLPASKKIKIKIVVSYEEEATTTS
ncbi:MAG: hypothetical protein DRO52_04210, partial [Candidatus Hecatellales archaeon]